MRKRHLNGLLIVAILLISKTDALLNAQAAWRWFVSCVEALRPDQAAPLWQAAWRNSDDESCQTESASKWPITASGVGTPTAAKHWRMTKAIAGISSSRAREWLPYWADARK
jgi:hypothetical protein